MIQVFITSSSNLPAIIPFSRCPTVKTFRLCFPVNNPEKDSVVIKDDKEDKLYRYYTEFIGENARYPLRALENGIDGLIKATYDVNNIGEISNIRIKIGTHRLLIGEVVKLIQRIPANLALIKTGGKAAKEVEFTATFRILDRLPTDGSYKSKEKIDVAVVALPTSTINITGLKEKRD